MSLVRYGPYQVISQRFNCFFDTLSPMRSEDGDLLAASWHPPVDVYDQDGNAVIQAELPGVKKEDIEIDVSGNVLTLKGLRRADGGINESNFYYKERFYGFFQRSFTLSEAVDPESVVANFGNGVLKVTVPRPKAMKTRKIEVGSKTDRLL